jgi:hypothetical protein
MEKTQEQLQAEWEAQWARRVVEVAPVEPVKVKPGRKPPGKAAVKPAEKMYAISESELAVFELGTVLLKTLVELPQAKVLLAELRVKSAARKVAALRPAGESSAALDKRNERKADDVARSRSDSR